MHPQYRSDHPGDCPSCGMRLEPVREEGGAKPAAADDGTALPAGAVRVSPERQQTIGVRLGVVERVSGTRTLRTTGRVAPNENAVYPLVAGADGLVREVRGATTGSLVKKNEVLLSFYAPEFVNAQQSYSLGARHARPRLQRAAGPARPAWPRRRALRQHPAQPGRLRPAARGDARDARARASTSRSSRRSTASCSSASASVGLRFDRGFEFYRIADLRRVWILADVYENQAPFIRAGRRPRITSQDQDRRLEATVSRAEPIFDEATRTLKVRLETENPGFALKPGMFVDVEFAIELPPTLVVPADAIVDSGLRKTVFVDRGNGYFEPRLVETGLARSATRSRSRKGLMAGERIVISGTFLIDSESRMKAGARRARSARSPKDPVCGMDVDEKRAAAAGMKSEHGGTTYYFCADELQEAVRRGAGEVRPGQRDSVRRRPRASRR